MCKPKRNPQHQSFFEYAKDVDCRLHLFDYNHKNDMSCWNSPQFPMLRCPFLRHATSLHQYIQNPRLLPECAAHIAQLYSLAPPDIKHPYRQWSFQLPALPLHLPLKYTRILFSLHHVHVHAHKHHPDEPEWKDYLPHLEKPNVTNAV